jgi:ABC-type bacteriocin/lantibiotic exporter with double-glycine peptidase domain
MLLNHTAARLTDLLIIIFAGLQILKGEFTIGGLVMLLVLGKVMLASFTYISLVSKDLRISLGAIKRISEIMGLSAERMGINSLPNIRGEIRFSDVWFSYEDGIPVLKGVNFTIEPHKMTAIVGRSGIGKTTIANLLLGFYQPTKGKILIDGLDMKRFDLASLRRYIGFVPQDPFLFNRDIEENITMGREIKTEQLRRIMEFTGVSELAEKLRGVVGEDGALISGGEKQRIAIARALVTGPKIIIFDEATSSLDSISEARIKLVLGHLKQEATVIVIAHRLATIRSADWIIFLEGGEVVAQGNHDDLYQKSEGYRTLFAEQMVG